ncbi:MAG: hypothetical protein FWD29_05225 [Micrococcales bacterium]|nr:hypothetical protein [Micrococcales bacterium]
MASGGPHPDIASMVERLEAARSRGAKWIVSRIGDDGQPVGADRVNTYYRVPWALQITGHVAPAAAAMAWIERHALTSEGDLRPGAAQKNWSYPAEWTNGSASYPLSNLAYGAWLLERYDTAGAIMQTLASDFQDPASGGGYIERPECRSTGRQDILCTAQIGLTALLTGRREMAEAAFGWFERLWALQPKLPNRLYLSTIGPDLAVDPPKGKEFGYWLDIDKPRQAFFNPGLGAAFMGRYAMATGSTSAVEIGRGLLDVARRAHESKYDYNDTVHVGKFAWGAGVMMDVEPDESHLADAMRLGQWFLDCQLEDGRWNPTKFLVPEPGDTDALWKTGEHILLMTILDMALAAWPRGTFGN